MLTQDRRTQLDGIVQKMDSGGASTPDIQAIVNDFKSKYDVPQDQRAGFHQGDYYTPAFQTASVGGDLGNYQGTIGNTLKAAVRPLLNIFPAAGRTLEDVASVFKQTNQEDLTPYILPALLETTGLKFFADLSKANQFDFLKPQGTPQAGEQQALESVKEPLLAGIATLKTLLASAPQLNPEEYAALNKPGGIAENLYQISQEKPMLLPLAAQGISKDAGISDDAISTMGKPIARQLTMAKDLFVENRGNVALEKLKNNLTDFFTKTKAGTKIIGNEQAVGRDTASFLMDKILESPPEQRNLYLKSVSKDGQFQPAPIIAKLATDAEQIENYTIKVAEENSYNQQKKPLEQLRQDALTKVASDFRMHNNTWEDAQDIVNEEFDAYERNPKFGDNVNVSQQLQMKRGQYSLGYKTLSQQNHPVPFRQSVARDIGLVLKNSTEAMTTDPATGQSLLKDLNDYASQHYQAMEVLNGFNGNVVKNGRLGVLHARILGGIAGGVGGGVMGLARALGAEWTGGKIAQYMMQNSISNPMTRAFIRHMAETNPEIMGQAMEYLQKQAGTRASTLRLPSPRPLGSPENPFIPTPPTSYEPQAGKINYQPSAPILRLPAPRGDVSPINQGRPIPVMPRGGFENTGSAMTTPNYIPPQAPSTSMSIPQKGGLPTPTSLTDIKTSPQDMILYLKSLGIGRTNTPGTGLPLGRSIIDLRNRVNLSPNPLPVPALNSIKSAGESMYQEELALYEQSLQEHPARGLAKYVASRGQNAGGLPEVLGGVHGGGGNGATSKFGVHGDDIMQKFGFTDSEEARASLLDYKKLQRKVEEFKANKQQHLKEYRESVARQNDEIDVSEIPF